MARPVRPSIDALTELEIPALRALWQKLFGSYAPAQAKRDLLTRCLAYALQETGSRLARQTSVEGPAS